MAPEDQDADPIHEADQQHLGKRRVAQTECRLDGCLETRHGIFWNQIACQELLHQGAHAPVHHQFGTHQQGDRDQEADVNFDIHQERNGRHRRPEMSFQRREQQQRQPGQQRDDDDALARQFQCVVGQTGPTKELEERPPRTSEKSGAFWSRLSLGLDVGAFMVLPSSRVETFLSGL